MAKLKIKEGTTSKLVRVFIQDSSATDGSGLTGLVYNSSGLTAYYLPEGDASATAITLATATAGTYTSGGFVEVDSTNLPGVYEVGLPDAVLDNTSEGSTLIMLKGATNMAPVLLEIELDKIDYRGDFWTKFESSSDLIVTGTVQTGTTAASTTAFSTSLTSEKRYEGRSLIFAGGTNEGLVVKITAAAMEAGELRFTVEDHNGDPMPNTPTNTDPWVII